MQVKGKEIKFLRTVKINFDIAKICPEGKLEKIDEVFGNDESETSLKGMIKFIQLMNQGYEEYMEYEGQRLLLQQERQQNRPC